MDEDTKYRSVSRAEGTDKRCWRHPGPSNGGNPLPPLGLKRQGQGKYRCSHKGTPPPLRLQELGRDAENNYPTPLSSRLLPTANSQTQMTQRIQSVEVNLRTTASGGVEKGREKNKKKKKLWEQKLGITSTSNKYHSPPSQTPETDINFINSVIRWWILFIVYLISKHPWIPRTLDIFFSLYFSVAVIIY